MVVCNKDRRQSRAKHIQAVSYKRGHQDVGHAISLDDFVQDALNLQVRDRGGVDRNPQLPVLDRRALVVVQVQLQALTEGTVYAH